MNNDYPKELKCCICGQIMERIFNPCTGVDYYCRNKDCKTYEGKK